MLLNFCIHLRCSCKLCVIVYSFFFFITCFFDVYVSLVCLFASLLCECVFFFLCESVYVLHSCMNLVCLFLQTLCDCVSHV